MRISSSLSLALACCFACTDFTMKSWNTCRFLSSSSAALRSCSIIFFIASSTAAFSLKYSAYASSFSRSLSCICSNSFCLCSTPTQALLCSCSFSLSACSFLASRIRASISASSLYRRVRRDLPFPAACGVGCRRVGLLSLCSRRRCGFSPSAP
eukprot:TRINITY_DN4135_c0_g2_i5.p1 TRINITY_DN4135_c0_g2~~TRINITY_DN4135_c0_g2_i5.p1  ORF type:complete len:154 (+),score=13.18 TRINITY_DN4135_c0_g2_i5:150-611(+)